MKINSTQTTTKIIILLLTFGAAQIGNAQTPSWQWGKRGGSSGTNGTNVYDNVVDMATDTHGNVYVLASNTQGNIVNVDGHQGIGVYDRASVASWDCNGNFRWMKTYGGGASLHVTSLQLDTLGGVYISGSLNNESSVPGPAGLTYLDLDTTLPVTNKTMFLIKYDTSGTMKWLKMPQPDTISFATNSFNGIFDMDVSPRGDIFLYSLLTPASYDENAFVVNERKMFVIRYNSNGVFQNLTPLDITVSGTVQQGLGYANLGGNYRKFSRDYHNGRYYLSGSYDKTYGTLGFGSTTINSTGGIGAVPMYLAAFDDNGNNLWVKQSDSDKWGGIPNRPIINNQGQVYIGGGIQPTNTFNGFTFTNGNHPDVVPFIMALDSIGNSIWANNGNTTAGSEVMGLTYTNNTIGATGFYSGPLIWEGLNITTQIVMSGITDIFLARFNSTTGQIIGLDSIASNAHTTYASAITSDKNNNFYVGGQFGDQLYPANDTITNTGGMYDWFVAKFGSANCNCTIPQPSYSYTNSGDNYNFTYTGSTLYTNISWDFGDGSPLSNTANPIHSYATSGNYNVCVTVTNACGNNVSCQQINTNGTGINDIAAYANIRIYPNPATQEIIIDNASAGTILDIYNTTGQLVLHTSLKGTKDKIVVSQLSSGLYLMRFIDKEGRQGNYKFVKQG